MKENKICIVVNIIIMTAVMRHEYSYCPKSETRCQTKAYVMHTGQQRQARKDIDCNTIPHQTNGSLICGPRMHAQHIACAIYL